eukprot:TRINITY_DN82315_c0_g1_i1.p1 TRINITY_DN82315_c0_g1~~TRINITY_DN82315_c0_g1_i1.p1  ORF type:complete len:206 (-),score=30.88 TRINITY_DN82315_c0_g1_i1:132-749(-)
MPLSLRFKPAGRWSRLSCSVAIICLAGRTLSAFLQTHLFCGLSTSKPSLRSEFRSIHTYRQSTSTNTELSENPDSSAFNSLVESLWDRKDPARALEILDAVQVDLTARLNGKTALHYAAIDGHAELVRELIARGAATDAPDEQRGTEGMTPLIWAAMNGHLQVCEALVELGADTSIKEKGGMTAAEIARAYDHRDVFDILNALKQ